MGDFYFVWFLDLIHKAIIIANNNGTGWHTINQRMKLVDISGWEEKKKKSGNITELSTFVSKFNIKYIYKNLIYEDIF